jgi:putative SOS response-associated peptidase YedK
VDVPPFYKPHYNAAPSQLLPVITADDPAGLSIFYWGLSPERAKNKKISERIINLKAEDILEKSVYRKAIQSRRCIIPADGFYVWKKFGKKTSIPYRFVETTKQVFSFAGVWEEYEDESGLFSHTFSIITIAANPDVIGYQERMPVILEKQSEAIWLSQASREEQLMAVLQPLKLGELESYSISPRINTLNHNDAALILPAPPADQYGNLTLFG